MNNELIQIVRGKGLLLEKDVCALLEGIGDNRMAVEILDNLVMVSGQKLITKIVMVKNIAYIRSMIGKLSGENYETIDRICGEIGLSLEVMNEQNIMNVGVEVEIKKKEDKKGYQIFYAETTPYKKVEVKDFVGHFRSRYQQLQRILMNRAELQQNLVSINKISSQRASLSIIGIVKEKRVTKNKNMIITFEDLTGEINALVKSDKPEIYGKAEELQVDDVVGIKGSGNRDLMFIYDIFYPDAFVFDKIYFEEDINIAFISDLHCGSKMHLEDNVEKFLDWLNSGDEDAKKIRYLFIVGDNVDGVGVFPGQENLLKLKSMGEQYALLASYLKRVPKYITMFMCPGQHDAVRVAEPQPIIGKKYARDLYDIENLTLVTNPTMVKLIEGDKVFKVFMYHGASIHTFINEIKELREIKAHNCPAKAVRHILKRRHLAPMHGISPSIVYVPNEKLDPLVITEVPDIFATGEVHRLDIENYNGVIIITGSCWQSQTPFEEKVGNVPDPGKVPVFNLKTRELKVFSFMGEEKKDI